jgi:hypothetical protein
MNFPNPQIIERYIASDAHKHYVRRGRSQRTDGDRPATAAGTH